MPSVGPHERGPLPHCCRAGKTHPAQYTDLGQHAIVEMRQRQHLPVDSLRAETYDALVSEASLDTIAKSTGSESLRLCVRRGLR